MSAAHGRAAEQSGSVTSVGRGRRHLDWDGVILRLSLLIAERPEEDSEETNYDDDEEKLPGDAPFGLPLLLLCHTKPPCKDQRLCPNVRPFFQRSHRNAT